MDSPTTSFHPITKFFAYLGAILCFFFGGMQVVASVFALPDLLSSLRALASGVLVLLLAWSFHQAAKYSTNPLVTFSLVYSSKTKAKGNAK